MSLLGKRLYMGIFDSMLVKYGAVMVAYGVLGIPVFGSQRETYLKGVSSDTSSITRDYIRNSSLLISLAKAIGRIVVSYKEVQNLAGYTSLVYEMKEVIDDLKHGSYARIMSNKDQEQKVETKKVTRDLLQPLVQGEITFDDKQIKLINVPLNAPNGDVLGDPVSCIVSFARKSCLKFRLKRDIVFCSLVQTEAESLRSIELLGSCGRWLEESLSPLTTRK